MLAEYRLGFDPNFNAIIAVGPELVIRELSTYIGSTRFSQPGSFDYVALPASKPSMLFCESVYPISGTTDLYKQNRKQYLSPSENERFRAKMALDQSGFNLDQLKEYQLDFVAMGLTCPHGIFNASEQGTGKTRMTLALLAAKSPTFTLIVAPKTPAFEWKAEYDRLKWRDKPFHLLDLSEMSGPDKVKHCKIAAMGCVEKPAVCVITYAAMRDYLREYMDLEPSVVVYDESQMVKGPNSRVCRAAKRLSEKSKYTICLSGTPLANHIGDMYMQLCFADHTVLPFNHTEFMSRYAKMIMKTIDMGGRSIIVRKVVGMQNIDDYMARISRVWFRVPSSIVKQDAPEVEYREVRLKMPKPVKEIYKGLEEEGEAFLGDGLSLAGEQVTMIRKQQLIGGFLPEDEKMIRYPSVKKDWIRDFVKDVLIPDFSKKAIIWLRFTEEIKIISEMLDKLPISYTTINGASKDTPSLVSKWKEYSPDSPQIMLAQIDKACRGLNLQEANFHIWHSYPWSHEQREQAIFRTKRIGRKGPLTIIDLLVEGSIDREILSALKTKRDFANRLVLSTENA